MQVLSTDKDSPQAPMELQSFTLHFVPTWGPVSRCNHSLKNADSAHLGPASFSPGCLGQDNEDGHCIVVVVVVVVVVVTVVPWSAVSLQPSLPSPVLPPPLLTPHNGSKGCQFKIKATKLTSHCF